MKTQHRFEFVVISAKYFYGNWSNWMGQWKWSTFCMMKFPLFFYLSFVDFDWTVVSSLLDQNWNQKKNKQIFFTVRTTTLTPIDNEISYGRALTTVKKTDIGPAHVLRTNTRPPLAGPYAFSRIPKPYRDRPRVHLMHAPSDAWLFESFSSG